MESNININSFSENTESAVKSMNIVGMTQDAGGVPIETDKLVPDITTNGSVTILPSSGYGAMARVDFNVSVVPDGVLGIEVTNVVNMADPDNPDTTIGVVYYTETDATPFVYTNYPQDALRPAGDPGLYGRWISADRQSDMEMASTYIDGHTVFKIYEPFSDGDIIRVGYLGDRNSATKMLPGPDPDDPHSFIIDFDEPYWYKPTIDITFHT